MDYSEKIDNKIYPFITAEEVKKDSIESLFKKLDSNQNGLNSVEVKKRKDFYGINTIIEKKKNPILKYLLNFWGPIPWLIEIAIILSAVIQHWIDLIIITILLVFNSIISFWEEFHADNAIEILKNKLAINSLVLRNKSWVKLPAIDLVPGDLVKLQLGEIIPADVKIVDTDYLLVDQSSLTGESLPVEIKAGGIAFSGSIVKRGRALAVIYAIGSNTYFGKTTKLLEVKTEKSQFQIAIKKIGDFLIAFDVFLVAIIIFASIIKQTNLSEIIEFSLVLTVAAIPVALPAVLSVTMITGALKLTKKGAIVRKLVAIEEMAGIDVLCTDKTGTLTKNKLSVTEIKSFNEFNEKDTLLYALLASETEENDSIDLAVAEKSKSIVQINNQLADFNVRKFVPFDPILKRSEASIEDKKSQFRVTKGAPQIILALITDIQNSMKIEVNSIIDEYAVKGYRSILVAKTDSRNQWKMVGIIAFFDPPRDDTKSTIQSAKDLGLDIKMITGDHIAIAKELASKIGLGTNIISLNQANIDDLKDSIKINDVDGYAEVLPEHKFQLVKSFQKSKHLVAMTGDGVNDAPALNKANVGIAVSNSTDAARSSADIVLTEPGIYTIVDTIKESRKIFARMENYSIYRIAETIRILIFITLSILVYDFFPITSVMIVLLALLNDIPIMTIAFDNVSMPNKSIKWNINSILSEAIFLGIIGVVSSFLILFIGLNVFHLDITLLQTFIYLKLSVAGHLTVFVARTRDHFWSIKPNKYLLLAVISTQLLATLIAVYGFILPAIGWTLAIFIWVYAFGFFIITDYFKVMFIKRGSDLKN